MGYLWHPPVGYISYLPVGIKGNPRVGTLLCAYRLVHRGRLQFHAIRHCKKGKKPTCQAPPGEGLLTR